MRTLNIDIETYSSNSLKTSGVYKYCEAEDFEILLFAYSLDGAPVIGIDLASGEQLPEHIQDALYDPGITKKAFNAAFERTCLSRHLYERLTPTEWQCTMVQAAMCGLPMSLGAVATVLRLPIEKDTAGKALIRYFCLPCKPTKTNGGRTRNLPHHDPEKWAAFKAYCIKDVEVEMAIGAKLAGFETTEAERKLWFLDQKINDFGILLDPIMVQNAIAFDVAYRERLTAEAVELSGLANPNSAAQLKNWLSAEINADIPSLKKDAIPSLLENSPSEVVTRMLQIRMEMSKTSVKKYVAMQNMICGDNRARGLTQYYGANRTGRFAGRGIQLQNLPQNHLRDLGLARQLVTDNNLEMLEMLFGNVPDTLSQLIRTAFVAPAGKTLAVCDFSAIELIVAAWLAGEQWVIDEYQGARKIYEQAASRMLGVHISTITKDSPARQKGKIATLACQYGGGVGALTQMGAIRMGLSEEELPVIVTQWRKANPAIVKYWYMLGDAAILAVRDGVPTTLPRGVKIYVKGSFLYMELPSGRKLSYVRPKMVPGKFDRDVVGFEGMSQTTKVWCIQDTYGPKLFENLCQAVARDCLAEAMTNVDAAGYPIACHVHDEIVAEVDNGEESLKDIERIMTLPIPWAKGLPMAADGFVTKYYKK